MAGASLLTLLDDIASLLDDISLMTKVAAKKTAGVLGDDLALNAQQVTGVRAEREIPIVWAVAKGSLINKAILVPTALAISAFIPWAVTPLLMLGGAYLCYEGFEKIAHHFSHQPADKSEDAPPLPADADLAAYEKTKIKGAIRTDFILSAEIIAITLGIVAGAPFLSQVLVMSSIAVIMTIGVYGIVAGIVKLDDLGLYLAQRANHPAQHIGALLLRMAPYLMKSLSVIGMIAMFMVGGGILVHGLPPVSDLISRIAEHVARIDVFGGAIAWIMPTLLHTLFGLVAGAAVLAIVSLIRRLIPSKSSHDKSEKGPHTP